MSHARSWFVVAFVASACAIGPPAALPPAGSPYPPSSREESEYLRTYPLGFAAGAEHGTSLCCLFGEQLEDPARVAASHGFEDGQEAARVAHFVRRDPSTPSPERERLLALLATPGPAAWAAAQHALEHRLAQAGFDLESAPPECDAAMALVFHSCRELGPRCPVRRGEYLALPTKLPAVRERRR